MSLDPDDPDQPSGGSGGGAAAFRSRAAILQVRDSKPFSSSLLYEKQLQWWRHLLAAAFLGCVKRIKLLLSSSVALQWAQEVTSVAAVRCWIRAGPLTAAAHLIHENVLIGCCINAEQRLHLQVTSGGDAPRWRPLAASTDTGSRTVPLFIG